MVKKFVILFVITLNFFNLAKSQELKDTISMSFQDLPLEIILDSISYKSGYNFSYNADIMPHGSLFTLTRYSATVEEILKVLFVGVGLEYKYIEDNIVINQSTNEKIIRNSRFSTITGWVRDEKTKEPIVGAHVFINGSTIGTTTDVHGNYKLFDVAPGNYIIVFSHVGYELASYEMNANNPAHHKINAALNQSVSLLKDLEISSTPIVSDDNWINFYVKFRDQFIGNAINSSRCEFVNPEVLEFAHSDSLDTYEAIAREPLIMENQGLGYRVFFNLDSYTSSSKEIRFHVTARFENLEAPTRRVKKRWSKNREKSYMGSKFHFFKALMADKLKEEGFTMYMIEELDQINHLGTPVNSGDVLYGSDEAHKFLKFDGYLVVIYDKELQSINYQQDIGNPKSDYTSFPPAGTRLEFAETAFQKSLLKLDTKQLKILSNGQLIKPEELTSYGYWSWERMSELIPIDYDPKSDNLK
ncbi:MAG: carboxypeptidase-like regulatory domain-containing protein [Marinoscillum sp.]